MFDELKPKILGEIKTDEETLKKYSHDASLLEVKPTAVISPKNAEDIKTIVKYVAEHKTTDPNLSITARAAGTCMAGGAINESIILDTTTYMGGVRSFEGQAATVLPGTFYRDFEKETLARDLILPCFTASKNLNAIGGMIGNNSAGEKTLRYGKMERYVERLSVVFADGNLYQVRPLTKEELDAKISQGDYEGEIYKNIFNLIEKNKEEIAKNKPTVSKNSAGYSIWNVWDGDTFDLTKLIVGSQGTLGIVTEAKLKLVPLKKRTKLFVIFMPDITHVSELVNVILPFDPESVESYDDATMKLAVKFFPEMAKTMKGRFLKLLWNFLPEAWMVLTGGIPKLILLVEITEDSVMEIDRKLKDLEEKVKPFGFKTHRVNSVEEAEKYWSIRRESFNLLRKHVRGRRTAPFVDDVIVDPKYLPEFMPKMRKILDDYKLTYTIAGHAGNGNFHIIPLMDMHDPKNVDCIMEVSEKVYDLIGEFHGSITAEHNDGIIRTPYLGKMFSSEMLSLFRDIKEIFDPQNIFNPGKKVPARGETSGGSLSYLKSHIASE